MKLQLLNISKKTIKFLFLTFILTSESFRYVSISQAERHSPSIHNNLDISYILMSKAPKTCLKTLWKTLKPQQKHQIVSQLDVLIEQLFELRFDQAESLFESEKQLTVNVCLFRELILKKRYIFENVSREPFRSKNEFYDAHISIFYDHVKSLLLSSHCFLTSILESTDYSNETLFHETSNWWSDFVIIQYKIDNCENKTDYIVAKKLLMKSFKQWNDEISRDLPNRFVNRFALHHFDLSLNNIFVDAKLNITCIIDWTFNFTVSLFMLLAALGLPQTCSEFNSSFSTAYEEKFHLALRARSCQSAGEKDLWFWMFKNSRPMWLFLKFIDLKSVTDYHFFKSLLQMIENNDDVLGLHRSEQTSKKYTSQLNELAKDDAIIEIIVKNEKTYFRDDIRKLAIARKLIFIFQWNFRYHPLRKHDIKKNDNVFIANKKLWLWFKKCLWLWNSFASSMIFVVFHVNFFDEWILHWCFFFSQNHRCVFRNY